MQLDTPIPLPDLKRRFSPLFSYIQKNQDATLLSLPHTGRTSLLRYLSTQSQLFPPFKLIDSDATVNSLTSYLSEILTAISASPQSRSILLSHDDYLIFHQIRSELTSPFILALTLKISSLPFLPDLDRLIVMLQKANPHLRIIWSIDTQVFRSYIPHHPSSFFGKNIVHFSTFSKNETIHSLTRHFSLKDQPLPSSLIKSALIQTGGIAGLFHPLVDSFPNFSLSHPLVSSMLSTLNMEIKLLPPDLLSSMATSPAISVISSSNPAAIPFKEFLLKNPPTAQEISLLSAFSDQPEHIFTRDEIARLLWDVSWSSRYSDWAIDKAISRLRTNIISPHLRILTVKNLGYRLISI